MFNDIKIIKITIEIGVFIIMNKEDKIFNKITKVINIQNLIKLII
jgi:hypothetical protein